LVTPRRVEAVNAAVADTMLTMTHLAQVAGRNAQQLRRDAGALLQDVARALRRYGLSWSTGRVGDFEAGRVLPSLPTLIAVAAALSDVTGKPVALADLFAGTGPVKINYDLTMPLATLRSALRGKPVGPIKLTGKVVAGPESDFVEVDERACNRLGVTTEVGYQAMLKLWGHTFRAERDKRAGPHANAQRRGQISRLLEKELQESLAL
jgi:hypothetical protein